MDKKQHTNVSDPFSEVTINHLKMTIKSSSLPREYFSNFKTINSLTSRGQSPMIPQV